MTEKLDQKLAKRQAASAPKADETQKFRTTEKNEAKIAEFMAADPGFVEWAKNLPRERLERALFLREADLSNFRQIQDDNRQRFRQSADRKLVQWLETRPDIAKEIDERIANLPADRKEGARLFHARNAAQREGMKPAQAPSGPKI